MLVDDFSEVTEKARKALLRDGGTITPIEEGNALVYRVTFPEKSIDLGNGETELPSGSVLGWDGSVDVDDNSHPLYLKRRPKRLGRPKERRGDYEAISLEVRKDLLAKIDASGKSRREYIEELLERHEGRGKAS